MNDNEWSSEAKHTWPFRVASVSDISGAIWPGALWCVDSVDSSSLDVLLGKGKNYEKYMQRKQGSVFFFLFTKTRSLTSEW